MKTLIQIERACCFKIENTEIGKLFNHLGNVSEFSLDLDTTYRYLNQFYKNNKSFEFYKGGDHIAIIDTFTKKRLVIITKQN